MKQFHTYCRSCLVYKIPALALWAGIPDPVNEQFEQIPPTKILRDLELGHVIYIVRSANCRSHIQGKNNTRQASRNATSSHICFSLASTDEVVVISDNSSASGDEGGSVGTEMMEEEKVVQIKGVDLTRHDLATLQPRQWLNDKVV